MKHRFPIQEPNSFSIQNPLEVDSNDFEKTTTRGLLWIADDREPVSLFFLSRDRHRPKNDYSHLSNTHLLASQTGLARCQRSRFSLDFCRVFVNHTIDKKDFRIKKVLLSGETSVLHKIQQNCICQ
jgi:hypothetical protein